MLISGALLAGIASGCRPGDVIDPPDMKAPVRVGEVTLDTIEAVVETMGALKPSEQAVLLTENDGRLLMGRNAEGKRLDEGDEVTAGQTIAELKNPEFVAAIAIDARKEETENAQKALERALDQADRGIASQDLVEPAQSTATNARYAYEGALAQLEKLVIKSPIAGRIVKLAEIVDGDRVATGTEIATVMSYRTILAEVDIANANFPLIETGQEARVTNATLKAGEFPGTVTMIRPVADIVTRAFKAEITIDNRDEKLRPGMWVRADIVVTRHKDAVVVPPELVLKRDNKDVVFIVEDEKAVAREVRIGIETKDATEIVNGIEPDDVLIVGGFETLRDGTPVRVSK